MDKIKVELWFDDKSTVREILLSTVELEHLLMNKEILSDNEEYLLGKFLLINEGDKIWYRAYCFLKGGLRSQGFMK
ncbi:MAG: hypothetical protein JXR88_00570 [Clostridia bacterium]|nr:hypothetical protein [Clostridia bacterium]